jgi:hypothetical protein
MRESKFHAKLALFSPFRDFFEIFFLPAKNQFIQAS